MKKETVKHGRKRKPYSAVADKALLDASGLAAQKTSFPISATEVVIRQHRTRKKKS
jgi:hypothetical protein